jgi:copper(I)-binding protein
MGKYQYLRRKRKIIKFAKKLGITAIFLVASYLLSLFSFYLYTQLSQILHPEYKGFLEFVIIGLVAGFIAVLVSLVNKRLILTIIISFFIDCLVDSILLFSKLGMQVVQFLPGLLISMSVVIASWNFLKRKLWLSKYYSQNRQGTKENINKKYALARKLIEDPKKITLEVFKEACELLQGIDPKIDSVLKKAEYISQTITFLKGGDAIGFALYNIKVKTEKDKEKKEKLLFFIDLINDIREEVGTALVRLDTTKSVDSIGRPGSMATVAASGPTSAASITMTIVAATTVVAAGVVGIIPGSSLVPKNESQLPITQISQEVNSITPSVVPTSTPILSLTPTPRSLAITVDDGWGHFTRIFSEPPVVTPLPPSILDYTTLTFYLTVHNTGTTDDRLIGGVSELCKRFIVGCTTDGSPCISPIIDIAIPANQTVEITSLACDGVSGVKQGDRIPVGLIFEKSGQIPILIEIRATPE